MHDAIRQQIERLYGSTSLRDELRDHEGDILLAWGERQVHQIAEQTPDPEQLADQGRRLRQVIKYINRFAGQRPFMKTPDQEREALQKIVDHGAKIGYIIEVDALHAALTPEATETNVQHDLKAILRLLTPEDEQLKEPPHDESEQ